MLSKEKKEALRAETVVEGGEHDSVGKWCYTAIAEASNMDHQPDSSEFLEHSAEVTPLLMPMLAAQVKAGQIKYSEHYDIANMESLLITTAKPYAPTLLRGATHFVKNIGAVRSFSDEAIDAYRNAIDEPMPGLRWSEAEQKLVRVRDATVNEKRLYLIQELVPAVARRLLMMLDSAKFTLEEVEQMKPGAVEALTKLREELKLSGTNLP